MFYVGQKVVCVDDKPNHPSYAPTGVKILPWDSVLKEGEIYTISEFAEHPIYPKGLHVRLVGIVRTAGFNSPFRVSRFRPLVEKKTDISIFHKLISPSELDKFKKDESIRKIDAPDKVKEPAKIDGIVTTTG